MIFVKMMVLQEVENIQKKIRFIDKIIADVSIAKIFREKRRIKLSHICPHIV
jgi:hypothetical protein